MPANPTPWLAAFLGRELAAMTGDESPELLAGPEAIDLAKLAGLQMHRAPARKGDPPDTAPSVAEAAIARGADPFDFYIDLLALTPQEAADCIVGLLGFFHATRYYAPSDEHH